MAPALLRNLLAGLTAGLVTLVYAISFAALIFAGRLTDYFPQGIGTALIGATVTAILVASRSSFPFAIAGPDANSAVLVALAAASIGSALDAPEQAASVYPTIWAAIALGTAATGLFLYLVGRFQYGRLARYIPYPVVGGFLAGTGWLITRSSFKVMTGVPLGIATLPDLVRGEALAQWTAGASMAAVLVAGLRRSKHFLTLPSLLLGGIVAGNLLWWLAQWFSPRSPDGWFFKPFSRENVWQAWNLETLHHIDWRVLSHQGGTLLAMLVIVMLSILLNSTGLELATSRNVDLDQELKANGVANLVNGCLGGMVGHLSINRCLLNRQAGAKSPVAGIIAGCFSGAVLLLGSSFLAYVPKSILGGLLLYIGSNLLFRWVWKARTQFSRSDYFLILLILIVIATLGFLQGVGLGILIACVLFIFSYGRTSSIKHTLSGRNSPSNVFRPPPQRRLLEQEGESVAIMVLHGFIFFGTANDLLEGIRRRLASTDANPLRYAVFDFRLVTGLDSSAALSFLKLRQLADKSGVQLVFTQLEPQHEQRLRQSGLFEGKSTTIRCFDDLDHGIEWCEEQILSSAKSDGSTETSLQSQLEALLEDPTLASGLMDYLEPRNLPEGQHVFRQGETSDGLYFLESGRVTVVVHLPNGKTLRRRTYTSGAILGEMGFYSKEPRSATVVAEQPSRLHYLSTEAFRRIEADRPSLASGFNRAVVNLVAQRLRHSEDEVRTLLQ